MPRLRRRWPRPSLAERLLDGEDVADTDPRTAATAELLAAARAVPPGRPQDEAAALDAFRRAAGAGAGTGLAAGVGPGPASTAGIGPGSASTAGVRPEPARPGGVDAEPARPAAAGAGPGRGAAAGGGSDRAPGGVPVPVVRGSRCRTARGPRLARALACGVVAVAALGGVALAAQNGALARPFGPSGGGGHHPSAPASPARATGTAPEVPDTLGPRPGSGPSTTRTGTVSPSPATGSPAPDAPSVAGARGLCTAYTEAERQGRSPAGAVRARLAEAAGGVAGIDAYCAALTGPPAPATGHGHGVNSAGPHTTPSASPSTSSHASPSASPSSHASSHASAAPEAATPNANAARATPGTARRG
ncbi:hypothetical protein [Actinacidiphila reveromycinica]|uniref:hypothetical protein n=1 Tax=Actinacidiphila reveromycinica TaxID=659352 RepID=UPI0019232FFB|nr:hypothetical protein [Streptomyces sp. SN-593]